MIQHNDNAYATMLLMSQMAAGRQELVMPLPTGEYYALRKKMREQHMTEMRDLLDADMSGLMMKLGLPEEEAYRVCVLLGRMLPLSVSLEKFYENGIEILTLDDEGYPAHLEGSLGEKTPPMLYLAGRHEMLRQNAIGVVGGMSLNEETRQKVKEIVCGAAQRGYAIVTDGATETAKCAMEEAERCGAFVIVFVADSLSQSKKTLPLSRLIEKRLATAVSLMHPDTVYTQSHACARNKCIYGMSRAVFVFAADNERGVTWDGAAEALRNGYCKHIYAYEDNRYPGNAQLLLKGAKPLPKGETSFSEMEELWAATYAKQLSLFDLR